MILSVELVLLTERYMSDALIFGYQRLYLFLNILGIGLILNARSYERAAKKDEEAVEEQAVENNSEVE